MWLNRLQEKHLSGLGSRLSLALELQTATEIGPNEMMKHSAVPKYTYAESTPPEPSGHSEHRTKSYKALLVMLAAHFVAMFVLMYSMVDRLSSVYLNLNQFYMSMLMVAPTALTMLLLMPSMYPNKRLNYVFGIGSVAALVLFYAFMRTQAFVGDKQFLRSMIPHHSGAILMCEKSKLSDPEIKSLCAQIIESQKREIDEMARILERL